LNTFDKLIDYVRENVTKKKTKVRQMTSFIEWIQTNNSLLEDYTKEFDRLYSQWRDDISLRAATYLYIGGVQNG
jgi:hypothetical protein